MTFLPPPSRLDALGLPCPPSDLPSLFRDAFPDAPRPSTLLLLAPQTAVFFHFHPTRPPIARPLSPHSRILPALARRCDAILNAPDAPRPPLPPSAHRTGQLVLDLTASASSVPLTPFLVAAANAGARIANASPSSPLRAPSPADEILDVVTPRGTPTGQTVPRALAHRVGIRHRTTHLWLYRRAPALEILLQFRSPQKDSYPSRYDISAAGHVPAGADWIPSALRELREELGVAASPSDLLPLGRRAIHTRIAFRGVPHDNLQVSAVYALHCPRPLSDFTPQPSEVDHLRWMPLADVFASLDSPTFPHCLSPDELRRLRALP